MDISRGNVYRNWFLLGLSVQVIAAWFSVGYYHPDEHYQILEFYNYRQWHSPLSDLPWEFSEHCRPALQPFLVYCLASALRAVGIVSPVILAFVLRLAAGILTWVTICRLIRVLLPAFVTANGKNIFVAASFFLWFVPYIGVRFSSETLASDCFFLAISVLVQWKDARWQQFLSAGLLLGFSLFLRLQMGFAFIGLAIWLLFVSKMHWRYLLLMILAGIVAIGISVVVDHWLYGVWVFTPYNYFNVNIIQNVAAKFGVYPWWYYFVLFFNLGVPPISLALLLLFFVGLWKKPLNLFSLVCITFFVGHCLIGHKELRFLFPSSFAFIFVACIGLDHLLLRFPVRPAYRFIFRLLAVVNIAILVFKLFTPAEEVIKYYNFIYAYAQTKKTTILSFNKSPYRMDTIENNFYKPRNMPIEVIHNSEELPAAFNRHPASEFIYLSKTTKPDTALAGYITERLYCQFPDWLLKMNINNWQERSYIWTVFRVYPKHN